ncbi:MAG: ferrochelatase [Nitrospirae bacterium]|nr:ferrochelatase [Nitrospirota bacterium]
MIGVLLLNLGGPDSLESVRTFLFKLFSDRDIIKLPVPSFLQRGLAWTIATLRSKKVTGYYRMIGGKSPILDITRNQAEALERFLKTDSRLQTPDSTLSYKVYFGMRYSPPFIKDMVKKIMDDGINKVIVLPLFPHYSQATTGSSFKEVKSVSDEIGVHGSEVRVNYIESWYDHPKYIDAISEKITEGLKKFDDPEKVKVIFSAHSLPKTFIDKGDPYLRHLEATISGVLERVCPISWHLGFQSRSGPVKWLEPSTDKVIDRLAEEGCKKILIVPISFVSDHLETLYEIDILYRKMAEEKGVVLKRTESLNASPKFIEALGEIVLTNLGRLV